jgi:hypothetical protein
MLGGKTVRSQEKAGKPSAFLYPLPIPPVPSHVTYMYHTHTHTHTHKLPSDKGGNVKLSANNKTKSTEYKSVSASIPPFWRRICNLERSVHVSYLKIRIVDL